MGSAFSCDECTTISTSNVINLSDPLVLRLVDGVESRTSGTHVSTPDDFWFEKLNCIDESHSTAYGLTYVIINEYITRMDEKIKLGIVKPPCSHTFISNCYKRFPECSIKCAKEVDEFINCLDKKRLEKLLKMLEEYHKIQSENEAKKKKKIR